MGIPLSGLISMLFGTEGGQGLLNLWGASEQRRAEDEARAATEGRYNDALGILKDQKLDIGQLLNTQENDQKSASHTAFLKLLREQGLSSEKINLLLAGQKDSQLGSFDQFGDSLNQGFADRERDLVARLEGLGTQERKDTNRSFDESLGSSLQGLQERGLGSSTLLSGARSGNERERSDAIGRLEERLRREDIGLRQQLSGDRLNAQSQVGFGRSNLMGGLDANIANAFMGGEGNRQAMLQQMMQDRLGLGRQFDTARINFRQGNDANIVNLLGARNDIPPSINPLLYAVQQGAANGAEEPDKPGFFDQYGGAMLGAGAGVTGGIAAGSATALGAGKIAAGLFTMGIGAAMCIDGDADVSVPGGTKKMCDIEEGDIVLTHSGEDTPVLATNCGVAIEGREDMYIKLVTESGRSLIITEDHMIDFQPAGKYEVGELIPTENGFERIKIKEKVAPVVCGDLLLGEDEHYIANGFLVDSMAERLNGKWMREQLGVA